VIRAYPSDMADSVLYPLTSLVRQLTKYELCLPESLYIELGRYLSDLLDADRDRWAASPLLYRRVAAKIEVRIVQGEWEHLAPLPTGKLTREYGASADCLLKAYRLLWEHELVMPIGPRRRWCVVCDEQY
jgi:Bacterial regulatory proteins, gntR family